MGFILIKANKYIKVEANGYYHRIENREEATGIRFSRTGNRVYGK